MEDSRYWGCSPGPQFQLNDTYRLTFRSVHASRQPDCTRGGWSHSPRAYRSSCFVKIDLASRSSTDANGRKTTSFDLFLRWPGPCSGALIWRSDEQVNSCTCPCRLGVSHPKSADGVRFVISHCYPIPPLLHEFRFED